MKVVSIIKKFFIVLLITIFTFVTASVVSTFLFKDELINHFIREANKQLNTPITIKKISVSALDNFPLITLNFEDVYIEESYTDSSYPLIKAEEVSFTFNPIEVFKGNYIVEQVYISSAKCHIKVNQNGEFNYTIFKKTDASQKQKVALDLSKITLTNIDFRYSNDLNKTYIEALTTNTTANINIIDQVYRVIASGDYQVKQLRTGQTTLMANKNLKINTELTYDDENKVVDFKPSTLKLKESDFLTHGSYKFSDTPEIEFYVEGKNTTIQTLLSLLPDKHIAALEAYRSNGDVYFDLSLKGLMSSTHSPELQVHFGLLNAEIIYPEKQVKVAEANAEGVFTAKRINKLSAGSLELRNMSGSLDNKNFKSNIYLKNFDDPYVKMDFDGTIRAKSLINFINPENFSDADGELSLNLSLEGNINDLKKKTTASRVKTSGEIDARDLSFLHRSFTLPFEHISGNFLFNNSDLAISDVSGYYGSSDFTLNGFFKNIIAFLLFKDEPVGIEADLKSHYINLDELLTQSSSQESKNYSFVISPRLFLKFNCNVNTLSFRRFKPKNITGDLKIKNQHAFTDKLKLHAMGGNVELSGLVNATDTTAITVASSFTVNNVDIDSIFYVFENFNQSFLQDRHLKGKIMADVTTQMVLNEKLRLKPETLTAGIDTRIIGGELNDFEPMQRLAKYLDEDKLDHLIFSELRNDIHIKDQIIYLPQMEVSSNVTDIKISGTHTFDQKIDYRVIAPLRSRKRIDRDEAFGAIEEDTQGRTMLYLKIIGTTNDYKIALDKEGVKKKIVSDLRKEVEELKNAFKNKGLDKNKTIELQEDDYFDWDDDGK